MLTCREPAVHQVHRNLVRASREHRRAVHAKEHRVLPGTIRRGERGVRRGIRVVCSDEGDVPEAQPAAGGRDGPSIRGEGRGDIVKDLIALAVGVPEPGRLRLRRVEDQRDAARARGEAHPLRLPRRSRPAAEHRDRAAAGDGRVQVDLAAHLKPRMGRVVQQADGVPAGVESVWYKLRDGRAARGQRQQVHAPPDAKAERRPATQRHGCHNAGPASTDCKRSCSHRCGFVGSRVGMTGAQSI